MIKADVEKSVRSKGKNELLKHLDGKRLTPREAILGKCFDCLCGYYDGKRSCRMPDCSLYPFMPYRDI